MTDIKKSRFTKQQIIGFLKQAEAGLAVKEVSHGMTARTSAHALHGRQVAKRGQEGPRGAVVTDRHSTGKVVAARHSTPPRLRIDRVLSLWLEPGQMDFQQRWETCFRCKV